MKTTTKSPPTFVDVLACYCWALSGVLTFKGNVRRGEAEKAVLAWFDAVHRHRYGPDYRHQGRKMLRLYTFEIERYWEKKRRKKAGEPPIPPHAHILIGVSDLDIKHAVAAWRPHGKAEIAPFSPEDLDHIATVGLGGGGCSICGGESN